jgi:trimethylamine:corrinoid methyltransferase-like protein
VHETLETWAAAGRPSLVDEAASLAEQLLAAHQPLPLADDVERELRAIARRAAATTEAKA